MESTEERFDAAIRRGLARFSTESLQCKAAVAAISQTAAEAVGISLEEAQYLESWRIARLQAGAKGVDAQDFMLELGAESAEDLAEFRALRRRRLAEAIGVEDLG